MRCGRPRRMRLRQGQRFPAVKSNESQAAPTGTNVTVRAPALVSSPSAVTAGASSGRSMWISSRSEPMRGHLLAPFHQDDGMLARILQFLVQAERFQFVQ